MRRDNRELTMRKSVCANRRWDTIPIVSSGRRHDWNRIPQPQRNPRSSRFTFASLAVVLLIVGQPAEAAAPITSPKEHFGFNMGDDYCLANYQQLAGYWAKLARESDRLKVVSIGTTEEGRPQLMGVVTSPANHKSLARYQEIARRLALAEGVGEAEARKLADEGKA